jgi:hypothetical protein
MLKLAENLVGKTIATTASDGSEVVLTFTDSTYCRWVADVCFEGEAIQRGSAFKMDSGLALRAGVFTQEEVDTWRLERVEREKLASKAHDLVTTIRVLRTEGYPCGGHIDELRGIIDSDVFDLNQRIRLTAFIAESDRGEPLAL